MAVAGIITSSSVGWTATGKVDGITPPVKFSIPLSRKSGAPEGTQVSLTTVVHNLPTTVNTSDIPLDDFEEFPFRPIEPPSIETVVLVASSELGSNSSTRPSQPVVVPGMEVTVKNDGQITELVKLSVGWKWRIHCKKGGPGDKNLVVPLKLEGGSHEGWETPVTLQIVPANGAVPSPKTVDPKDIPLDEFQDFNIPAPVDTELELTVTATQTEGAGTTLVVGDVHYLPKN